MKGVQAIRAMVARKHNLFGVHAQVSFFFCEYPGPQKQRMDDGSGGAPAPRTPLRAPLKRFVLLVVIMDGGSGGHNISSGYI